MTQLILTDWWFFHKKSQCGIDNLRVGLAVVGLNDVKPDVHTRVVWVIPEVRGDAPRKSTCTWNNDKDDITSKGNIPDSVLWQKSLHQQKIHTMKSHNTKDATKFYDYTTVTDQLRTVNWRNYSHPNGVVKLFTGLAFQLPSTTSHDQ